MDQSTIVSSLYGALSPDAAQRLPAEQYLLSCDGQPGFLTTLLNIASTTPRSEADTHVALLAAVTFKNSVNRCWGHSQEQRILQEEKQSIRSLLFRGDALWWNADQAGEQLFSAIRTAITKIARVDYPANFPSLYQTLTSLADHAPNNIVCARFWNVIYCVTEELSSRRLPQDVASFTRLSEEFIAYVSLQFRTAAARLAQTREASCEDIVRFICKTGRVLVLYGFSDFSASNECVAFLRDCARAAVALFGAGFPRTASVMHKSLNLFVLDKSLSVTFIPILDDAISSATAILQKAPSDEKCLLRCVNLLAHIVGCSQYRPGADASATETEMQAFALLTKHFNTDATSADSLLSFIVLTLMRQRDDQIALLLQQPEEYFEEDGRETEESNVQVAGETLLSALFLVFHDQYAAAFVRLLGRLMQNDPSLSDYRLQEAIYRALNLLCYDLYDGLDMNASMESLVLARLYIVSQAGPVAIPVIRRIVETIGRYADRYDETIRERVFSVLSFALEHPHPIVRLSAAKALRNMLDDMSFSESMIVDRFCELMHKVVSQFATLRSPDAHFQVLSTLKLLIVQCPSSATEHVDGLMEVILSLWTHHHASPMLRAAILHLVHATLERVDTPAAFLTLVTRLLGDGLALCHEPDFGAYYWEPLLELWGLALQHVTVLDGVWIQLFEYMPQVLARNIEHIDLVLKVVEGNAVSTVSSDVFMRVLSVADAVAAFLMPSALESVLAAIMQFICLLHVMAHYFHCTDSLCSMTSLMGVYVVFEQLSQHTPLVVRNAVEAVCRFSLACPAFAAHLPSDQFTQTVCECIEVLSGPVQKKVALFALMQMRSEKHASSVHGVLDEVSAVWYGSELKKRLAIEWESRAVGAAGVDDGWEDEADAFEQEEDEDGEADADDAGSAEREEWDPEFEFAGVTSVADVPVFARKRFFWCRVDPILAASIPSS